MSRTDDSSLPPADRRQPGRSAFIAAMVLLVCAFAMGPFVAISGNRMLLDIAVTVGIVGVISALAGALISFLRSGDER